MQCYVKCTNIEAWDIDPESLEILSILNAVDSDLWMMIKKNKTCFNTLALEFKWKFSKTVTLTSACQNQDGHIYSALNQEKNICSYLARRNNGG